MTTPIVKTWAEAAAQQAEWWRTRGARCTWEPQVSYRAAVLALPKDATPAEIDAAQGGSSQPRCDGCDGRFEAVVQVGQEPDYESQTCDLCEGCLVAALEALRASR